MSLASPATPSPVTPMGCQRWWRHRTNPDWPLATMAEKRGSQSGHRRRRSYLDCPEERGLGVGGGTGRVLGCLCRRRHIRRRRGSANLGSSHRVTLHTLTAIPIGQGVGGGPGRVAAGFRRRWRGTDLGPAIGTLLTSLRVVADLSHLVLASTTIAAARERGPYFLAHYCDSHRK